MHRESTPPADAPPGVQPSQPASVGASTDAPDLALATPDLASDPDTRLAHANVMAGLFGDEPEVPTIGRYPIFARVGQGAMGVVYACYDAQLDRRIAVKVLRADVESASVRARMVREAQAMAKLSHPNVAHVYEVGEDRGRMFVAMEFVKGTTLRAWWEEAPRRWQDVLAVGVAAGRGLSAAHAEGLTHRDFKPDNVMITPSAGAGDHRVRVMDFGLVRFESRPSVPDQDETDRMDDARMELTRSGALVGTPAYMAPEQLRDTEAGPAADQFAFCVTLWEALFGQRPYVGKTFPELAENLRAGRIEDPPRTAKVPTWLRRALARGLRVDPAQRYASMAELLAVLEQGTRRARTRRMVAAVGVLAVVGVGAEGARRWDRARSIAGCETAGATIDEVWRPAARTRVHDALAATQVSYAATTAEKVMPWLDRQADAWRAAQTEACLDAEVRGVWSADVYDRSLWCLDERRMELEALVTELADADAASVEDAVTAAAELASVAACRDRDLLGRLPPPPTEQRDDIRAVRSELAVVDALARTGDSDGALEVARAARERAEAIGWSPLLAAALGREARELEAHRAFADAERVGKRAYFEAARTGAWDIAGAAALRLATLVGETLARQDEGVEWSSHAEVAMAYAGDAGGLREADRLADLAILYTDRFDEARELHARALAIREAMLGPEHPAVGHSLNNLANIHQLAGDLAQARPLHERALAIRETALGPDHPAVASSLNNLGSLELTLGDSAKARRLQQRALAIREAAFGPDHPMVAQTLHNLAKVYFTIGDYDRAREALGRTLAITEKVFGKDHPAVAMSLSGLAQVHRMSGDLEGAVPLFERAVAIYDLHEANEQGELDTRYSLAWALAATGRDRARVRRLAQQVRDGWRGVEEAHAIELAQVAEWLADR